MLVTMQAVGKPMFSGFCHCTICCRVGGTDRQLVCAWSKAKFAVTNGKDKVKGFASSSRVSFCVAIAFVHDLHLTVVLLLVGDAQNVRFFCKVCGSAAFSDAGAFFGLSPTLFGEAEG